VVGVILLVTLAVVLPACATGSRQDATTPQESPAIQEPEEQPAPVEEEQAVVTAGETPRPAGKYDASLARIRQWRSALR